MGIERVVDIAGDRQHISLKRGFLLVSRDGEERGRVPLDDVAALIVHGHGSTFSANLVSALAERSVFAVFCNAKHAPTACLWPLSGHHAQGGRMRAQVAAKLPLQKRLWQQIVIAKIETQAAVLSATGGEGERLRRLVSQVRSGDPDNREAQAARHYWPRLMGNSFRRDRDADGANALLNYGYTVLRACVARAIVASGLHPTIALHHRAAHNDMALADDLMEPFRPYIDVVVRGLVIAEHDSVCPEAKEKLTSLLAMDLDGPQGITTLAVSIQRAAHSLADSFANARPQLVLPAPPSPSQLASFGRA
ncbi:type II CRISPR-associated endonuclease Cas1 [Pseudopontixanthobacter vadosimaris]|uniref:type II CRISPR-associated endonuclease Cas1 n=1 Tax=Pseudopontixanthobacter vadosimaris TaxID=2726450 RepID=UPI00197B4EF6|nr:type II CRISPR-associated endonuclease Cas1 [Pseudopontixanthobacter vadosimaris]